MTLFDADVARLVAAHCLRQNDDALENHALLMCIRDLQLARDVIEELRINGCIAEINSVRDGDKKKHYVILVAKGVFPHRGDEAPRQ